MIELGIQERSAISALQWLPVEGIRAQYAEYLKDCEGCNRIEILRAIVIYRIQEKFYGRRVSRETERLMEKAVEGDKLLHAPADDVRSSRRKLVRNWKGKDYEVFVVNDSLVEYEGKKYKSLTAVAKAITGTHWNGPAFFGIKKTGWLIDGPCRL